MKEKKLFKEKSYCIIKSVISDEMCNFLNQYCLFDELKNPQTDKDCMVPRTHSKYADLAMESLLVILQDKMQEITELKLYPTYSYYRVYRNGSTLHPHIDRPACEISTTLCINYDYNDTDYHWPIYIEGSPIRLQPGDMVIYKGCELEHWREEFTPKQNSYHIQGFFHYVDANGPHKNAKYDSRLALGTIDKNKNKSIDSKFPYIQYVN